MKSFKTFFRINRRSALSLGFVLVLAALAFNTGETGATSTTAITSNNAITALEGRAIRVASTTAAAGGQVTVAIEIDSMGDEVAASFTLNFDPTVLSNPVVIIGSAAPGGTALGVNANEAATGKLGILVDSSNPFSTSPPARQIIAVTFSVAQGAALGASPITFVTTPTPLSVSSPIGVLLSSVYQGGTVTITAPTSSFVTVGGRVTTPSGQNLRNAVVTLIDSNNVRRTATTSSFGLYSFGDVETGRTFTLTVSSKRFRFSPRVTQFAESVSNLDFAGLE